MFLTQINNATISIIAYIVATIEIYLTGRYEKADR